LSCSKKGDFFGSQYMWLTYICSKLVCYSSCHRAENSNVSHCCQHRLYHHHHHPRCRCRRRRI